MKELAANQAKIEAMEKFEQQELKEEFPHASTSLTLSEEFSRASTSKVTRPVRNPL